MDYRDIQKLGEKLYFTTADVAAILNIKIQSARVQCTRAVKKGLFIRLKNNFYVLDERWRSFSKEDLLRLANFVQVPSYISFLTALSFYEVTTQVQRGFIESASTKRSAAYDVKGVRFNFYKMKRRYYSDFVKKGDLFIATKEKAFLDSVYLYSFGKYRLDFSSLDISKLNRTRLLKLSGKFPLRVRKAVKKICRI